MKKAPLLITLGIVLLTVGAFFAYKKFFQQRTLSVWDLVPNDAIFIYEKDRCNECIDQMHASTVWKLIDKATFYQRATDSLQVRLSKVLSEASTLLVSAHTVKRDEFDLVYYLPATQQLTTIFSGPSSPRIRKRVLNGIEIQEIGLSKQSFTVTNIDGIWVGSYTPFLVEDVIRRYATSSGDPHSYIQRNASNTIRDDAGNLYINLTRFGDLLSLFLPDHFLQSITPARSALLDIKASDDEVVLNGFSTDSIDHSNYLLSIFNHQTPVSFGMKHLVPNRAIAVTSYGISNGSLFFKDLHAYNHRSSKVQFDSLYRLTSGLVDVEKVVGTLDDELAVCFFESKGRETSKVILIETKSVSSWTSSFQKLALKYSEDSVFHENYSQYEIYDVPVYRLPQKLFSPLVTGFDHMYYTRINNVIVVADGLEELKKFLDDVDAEDTWGKSVSKNRFLESTLLESNISIYINPTRVWTLLSAKMHPRWKGFIREQQSLLQGLGMSSIQFSHLNNSYYTNALFTYRSVNEPDSKENSQRIITQFERPLVKMYAVKSHVNRSNEVLVQDSVNDLSLVSSDGRVLWKLALGERIISDVIQVDFFNNGKLQYFFATLTGVHVVDRLGNYVNPYPLRFPSMEIEHVSVIDYDNSKKYRILIADVDGNIRMYDKDGKPLLGWEPNQAGGSLATSPQHFRILAKDYIVALRKDGVLQVWNRRGEVVRGFPVKTEYAPGGELYLERGKTLSQNQFVIVASDGYRIKINPLGKIQGKETLAKTSALSNFYLINEKSGKTYLVAQQDEKQLQLTSEDGDVMLTYSLSSIKSSDLKYYDFGNGKSFISVREQSQRYSYVFDTQGNLLTAPPLEAQAVEIRPLSSDQFVLFFIQGNSLTIQPL